MLQQYQMRRQMVSIDFKKQQGLILKWNYNDLCRKNNYFRHIIVLLTSKIQIASVAVPNYIKHIKLGDLYTTIYSNSYRTVQIQEWREKTHKTQFNFATYLPKQRMVSLSFDEAAMVIQNNTQQINEPTILNFILQNQSQIQNVYGKIKQRQIANKIHFISTIFAPNCPNTISISDGINIFSLDGPYVFQFYHRYLNQMAIQRAHMAITCRNGEIGSFDQTDWKNTAFNKIQRTYYGPSIKYEKDILQFINTKAIIRGSYDLDISLEFKCFGGKIYTAEKKITISLDRTNIYNRTLTIPKRPKVYYALEDIELKETPFSSQNLVYFDEGVAYCEDENQQQ